MDADAALGRVEANDSHRNDKMRPMQRGLMTIDVVGRLKLKWYVCGLAPETIFSRGLSAANAYMFVSSS